MNNQFRIIAGLWRGRRFAISDHTAVRPSPERVRETLFNWLMHDIQGAICLDAFAGSGAIGLEALSRGAAHVYFVEQEKSVISLLRQHLQTVSSSNAKVLQAIMPAALSQLSQTFDIVFLDPPFRHNLIASMLHALQAYHCLNENALVYVEAEAELDLINLLTATWEILKQSKAGQVKCYLLKYISYDN